MPKLSEYLDHIVPGRAYDEFELERLDQIYEQQACEALGVPLLTAIMTMAIRRPGVLSCMMEPRRSSRLQELRSPHR